MGKGEERSPDDAIRVLELAVGNPYDADFIDRRKLLQASGTWPSQGKGWQTWWETLPAPYRGDESAVLALLIGSAEPGAEQTVFKPAVLRQARDVLRERTDACVEVAGRALRVMAALDAIVGSTRVMRDVRKTCWAATFGERLDTVSSMHRLLQTTPVLIHGPTGTGKELVAQALCLSMRGEWNAKGGWLPAPAESVHLASLPATFLESALFGHEQGAYSGAHKSRKGVFERCHGGVVFLDEIAELPMGAQVSLLRTLQEGRARKLGADQDHDAAPRIVSATHKDLEKLVEEGTFRADLLHRLSSVVIEIPPLVKRLQDIPALVEKVAIELAEPASRTTLRDKFEQFMKDHPDYDWPGNVRELHAVVRTLALGLEPRLRARTSEKKTTQDLPREMVEGSLSLREVQRWYCQQVVQKKASKTLAARSLGIDRGTLRAHLEGGDDEPQAS